MFIPNSCIFQSKDEVFCCFGGRVGAPELARAGFVKDVFQSALKREPHHCTFIELKAKCITWGGELTIKTQEGLTPGLG